MDYHLAPDPVPPPVPAESRALKTRVHSDESRGLKTRVHSDINGNVTAHLWQSVYLRCTVTGFIQGEYNKLFHTLLKLS